MQLNNKPWNSPDLQFPEEIYNVKGMLGAEERRCLHWLTENYCAGVGAIIDAGAFIGASAFCMAEGLSRNRRVTSKIATIHSYDLFVALDQYVADSISRQVRPLALNENYLDIFESQNQNHLNAINVHAGNLCTFQWDAGPIELLFIDVAKNLTLNSHVVRQFFPALVPGKSLLIQQDFYHIWHPYIHVTMEYLKDHFEIIDPLIPNQSRLYLLRDIIPEEKLERIVRYDFTVEERTELLLSSAAESPSPTREMLEAITLHDAMIAKNPVHFRSRLDQFERAHPEFQKSHALWALQAVSVIESAQKRGWLD